MILTAEQLDEREFDLHAALANARAYRAELKAAQARIVHLEAHKDYLLKCMEHNEGLRRKNDQRLRERIKELSALSKATAQ
jgi:hypothetical protein